tara:strand:- start:165 stop:320 length:156 start_codon:yes stop_codon:yes gene_type:complete
MTYMLKICSICGGLFQGYGNNAKPINGGRCCDSCNKKVLAARGFVYVEGGK